jgi:hypothetical protein
LREGHNGEVARLDARFMERLRNNVARYLSMMPCGLARMNPPGFRDERVDDIRQDLTFKREYANAEVVGGSLDAQTILGRGVMLRQPLRPHTSNSQSIN